MDYDESDMTEDEFDARWSTGRPVDIASAPRDNNQRAAWIVTRATERSASPSSIVVRDNHFAGEYEIMAPSLG